MVVYLISGSGQGAGKTTLAERLVGGSVYSIAGEMRRQLRQSYSFIDWDNKTQSYKDNTTIESPYGKTVREVLVNYGQSYSKNNPTYWVDLLIKKLYGEVGKSVVAIDDIRKMEELEALKKAFPNSFHFHVDYSGAVLEPLFHSESLKQQADYIVKRRD